LNGDGPQHFSATLKLRFRYRNPSGNDLARITAQNVGDSRYQVDSSNTFGGTTGIIRAKSAANSVPLSF